MQFSLLFRKILLPFCTLAFGILLFSIIVTSLYANENTKQEKNFHERFSSNQNWL